MDGQMSIFDYQPQMQEPEEKPYWPCDLCDVVFGSRECFDRRGYIWDEHSHAWLRDRFGKHIRVGMDKRECKYEPRKLNLQCFTSESTHGGAGVRFGKCPYFPDPDYRDTVNHCPECPEYIWFWQQVQEERDKGAGISEALAIIHKRWGIKSVYYKTDEDD